MGLEDGSGSNNSPLGAEKDRIVGSGSMINVFGVFKERIEMIDGGRLMMDKR